MPKGQGEKISLISQAKGQRFFNFVLLPSLFMGTWLYYFKRRGFYDGYLEQVSDYVRLMTDITGGTVFGWLYFADEEDGCRIVSV